MNSLPHEFRISVRGVRVGMYVSRLDRPWLNTPFPLEGFKVASDEDVRALQRLCNAVYIDTSRGIAPDLRHIEFDHDESRRPLHGQDEYLALRKTEWPLRNDFAEEFPQAQRAHQALKRGIEEVMHDLREGHKLQLDKLQDGVEAMIDSITRNPTAFSWLREIKRKDNYAYHHALACSVWAASFGRHLGLERGELIELTLAGLLFDVGKTRVDSEMLTKDAVFDDRDHATMRSHVQHSLDIMAEVPGVSFRIMEAVATHHERHNGSGYPNGLMHGAIPIFGRILGLIDSYDAMTSHRPHMPGRSPHQAVMELYEARDRLFQAELVELFIQTSGIYPIGSLVELTNGQVGVVTAVHSLKRLRPTVMLLLDEDKRPLDEFRSVDLGVQIESDGGSPLGIRSGLPQGAYGIDPSELFLD